MTFVRVLCKLRAQISRSTCNLTHYNNIIIIIIIIIIILIILISLSLCNFTHYSGVFFVVSDAQRADEAAAAEAAQAAADLNEAAEAEQRRLAMTSDAMSLGVSMKAIRASFGTS